MIIASDRIPVCYNGAAALASWIVLAGFFILPGTFTSLRERSYALGDSQVVKAVVNIPLLPLAGICYLIGILSLASLWFKFRYNYIWVLNHIFYPGIYNCISGLITLIINIYTARDGTWSPTAWVTLGTVSFSLIFTTIVSCFYKFKLVQST
ncbi:hypothetical protein F5883DRAFT_476105 [Diaporthe sp. PMI_573]|nr:hypothetical protein F5883DRAFT_476105 [Diaporthaceae sp. PMI_573]